MLFPGVILPSSDEEEDHPLAHIPQTNVEDIQSASDTEKPAAKAKVSAQVLGTALSLGCGFNPKPPNELFLRRSRTIRATANNTV